MKILGRTNINPTEDPEKVLRCILNIFPTARTDVQESYISFSVNEAETFKRNLRDQQIKDTASMVLQRELDNDSTFFFLNKQAAFAGKVNFTEGNSTLGDIEVHIQEGALELIEKIKPFLE